MSSTWKDIKHFEDFYQISDIKTIRRKSDNRNIKTTQILSHNDVVYNYVTLDDNFLSVDKIYNDVFGQ
jgi:hypothetical protein